MRLIVLLALGMLVSAAASAEIYTWRDAGGKVHYSDTPPPGGAKTIKNDSPPPANGATQKQNLAEKEMEQKKRSGEAKEARAKAEQEKAVAEEKRENCERLKAQLTALESGQRMARVGADGERIVLEDEGRAVEIERTRKSIANTCK